VRQEHKIILDLFETKYEKISLTARSSANAL